MRPRGLCVAVLGPDGAGKSLLIAHLSTASLPGLAGTRTQHLGPDVLGIRRARAGRPTDDPHGRPPFSAPRSVAKLGYLLFDYVVGYAVKVWPALVRGELFVFDRYYHDIIVDPRRFRYGGPAWLTSLAAHLVPRPDLVFVLLAPAELIWSRKQEVAREELARQLAAYGELTRRRGFVAVDASRTPEEVAADVDGRILDALARRVRSA